MKGAARRARQLQSGAQPLIAAKSTKACRVAQDEIKQGQVKYVLPRIRRSSIHRSTSSVAFSADSIELWQEKQKSSCALMSSTFATWASTISIARASRCTAWRRLRRRSSRFLLRQPPVSKTVESTCRFQKHLRRRRSIAAVVPPVREIPEFVIPKPVSFDDLAPLPEVRVAAAAKPAALTAIQEEIGDCTRCPLAYAGRRKIVFADGDPNARLMFVGEGPGADEDAQGLPFVGKAGQLLNNMIGAMGLKREQVYIANIVKCRPPANRVPEPVEANTCTPVSGEADRCGAAGGDRRAGGYGGDVPAGREAVAGWAARALAQLPWGEGGGDVPSGVSAA